MCGYKYIRCFGGSFCQHLQLEAMGTYLSCQVCHLTETKSAPETLYILLIHIKAMPKNTPTKKGGVRKENLKTFVMINEKEIMPEALIKVDCIIMILFLFMSMG
jgi:hypothetical protein